jgi:hypothetical protein
MSAEKLAPNVGSGSGVNPNNLRNWLNQEDKLRARCAINPDHLNAEGKHKGGRGNKKPGWQKSFSTGSAPWFPELEEKLDDLMTHTRRKRIRVSANDVRTWMVALVAEAVREDESLGRDPDERKLNWKGGSGWLRNFLKRKGWTRRRATNKRSHSPEDLIGPVLGWVRFLAKIRHEHPSEDDPIWGVFGPRTSFNVDGVPIVFCSANRQTLERKGSERVSIIVPGNGLDKRQATLHLLIRALGEQPWPTIILAGAYTADGKPDRKKRAEEMKKYEQYHVHVLWQSKAWLDTKTANDWAKTCLKPDLDRLGLKDSETLLISDNLDAQRSESLRKELDNMHCFPVYGPKNGTDVWQPVDHGIGREYQKRLELSYYEWTRTSECAQIFRNKKAPTAARRRELMVKWVHDAYEYFECERAKKEANNEHSMFYSAFLRTGALVSAKTRYVPTIGAPSVDLVVSAQQDEIDRGMNPEGLRTAMEQSKDPYFKQHDIKTFRDLYVCSYPDKCTHRDCSSNRESFDDMLSQDDKARDEATLTRRFRELSSSTNPIAKLLVKCIRQGRMKWAGMSMTKFLSSGVTALLSYLSETQDDGKPAHDIDLYRDDKSIKKLGKRFVTTAWDYEEVSKGAVDQILLTLRKSDDPVHLMID